jgi:hypothetical protein
VILLKQTNAGYDGDNGCYGILGGGSLPRSTEYVHGSTGDENPTRCGPAPRRSMVKAGFVGSWTVDAVDGISKENNNKGIQGTIITLQHRQ